jgi:hypothetical protein
VKLIPKLYFINMFNSTMMHLRDLPMFRTTGEIAHCTKFLISRVHNRSLWIDKRYQIHAKDIHNLIGISLEGEDVSQWFQGLNKHGKKKG